MELGMKIFSIAGPKGGCGKSTLALSLATRASLETGKVGLIDLDAAQGTATEWWVQRGRPVSPYLHDGEGTLDEMVEDLVAHGWTYCFIDGPPGDFDLIEMSILVSSVVLVPVKLSYFDAAAVDSVIGLCQRRKKPYAFVISEFDGRKPFENANNLALAMLDGRGPILKSYISYHPKHRLGLIEGKTGAELDRTLAREIDALWTEVKDLAGLSPKLKAVEGRRG
jgi:chromosome partitioning protein